MGGPDLEGSVLTWDGGLFGGKLGRIDVRGRLFLPLGAVKFEDGLQRDFAHVLLDGELFLAAVFFLVHPRAQLSYQLDVHALLQRSGKLRQSISSHGPVPVGPGFILALGVLPRPLRGEREDRVFGAAGGLALLCVRP